MKIANELLTLAREHHFSLSLGNKCVNTAKSGDTKAIKDLCQKISKTFRNDFSAHFETEELTIFAFLKDKSIKLSVLCKQLTDEHQQLYQLAEHLDSHTEQLLTFGSLLKSHTRLEELNGVYCVRHYVLKSHTRLEDRMLFPQVDLLSGDEKKIIAKSSLHQ